VTTFTRTSRATLLRPLTFIAVVLALLAIGIALIRF
jgi:hypothetical protein